MLRNTSKKYFCDHLSNQFRNRYLVKRYCSSSIAIESKSEKSKETTIEKGTSFRVNSLGVQMLSKPIYSQIFGQENPQIEKSKEFQEKVNRGVNNLKHHGLLNENIKLLPDVDLKMPQLQGKDLDEHFRYIANQQTSKYRELLNTLTANKLPSPPSRWKFEIGWTKYLSNGETLKVDFPDDQALIFDVEVCVIEGRLPTLATAASPSAWYSWCSPRLIESDDKKDNRENSTDNLISLETKYDEMTPPDGNWKERIIVGHNVSYDRALIKEQYYIKKPKTRFLDTMSMHIAISGMTKCQRSLMHADEVNNQFNDGSRKTNGEDKSDLTDKDWMQITSKNNLRDVQQLYCGGDRLNKGTRNVFVTGSMVDIRSCFQELMTYCSSDVIATHKVLQAILPIFLERFPHPVTLAGMLEINEAYLPVNDNWEVYIKKTKSTFMTLRNEAKLLVNRLADETLKLLPENKYRRDPWLWDLDWSVRSKQRRDVKRPFKKDEIPDNKKEDNRYPRWYRKFFEKVEESNSKSKRQIPTINYETHLLPKLLRLSWDGFPLHYNAIHGWGYLVPEKSTNNSSKLQDCDNNIEENSDLISSFWEHMTLVVSEPEELSEHTQNDITVKMTPNLYRRLPYMAVHMDNPLSNYLFSRIKNDTLKSESGALGERILSIKRMTSYWEFAWRRINDELAVWLKENELTNTVTRNSNYVKHKLYGAIIPRIIPFSLFTRRPGESIWLSKRIAHSDFLGSEMHSMVQTPPGYKFVGADIDSKDLWITALLGDSNFAGIHGCTAYSRMLLQEKSNVGSDIHSYTAKIAGISRDFAKVINYARIYGLGESFAQEVIRHFNSRLSTEEAKVKADSLFAATKGVKGYYLNEIGIQLYNEWKSLERQSPRSEACLTKSEILQMLEQTNSLYDLNNVISKSVWLGGTESAVFNQLEEIIHSEEPTTPVLDARISRSLEPSVVDQDFITSRITWVVQSSSADYLHLLLVCMRWLCDLYEIDARFSITIHDEVRYIVKEKDQYRAALALQISNLLTRAMFAYKLGMNDLPQSSAFLSSIDIDTVLRKEVTMDCKTPSNPNGLTEGYGIPTGEALNVYEIIDKTNGSLDKS